MGIPTNRDLEASVPHRRDVVRYLRRDLEIARSMAKLKADQAARAVETVVVLEARLAAAQADLRVFEPDQVLPPDPTGFGKETVEFTKLDAALGMTEAVILHRTDSKTGG